MNLKPLLLVGTLSAMGAIAFAEDAKPASPHTITGNFSLTSNYVFRGLTQSDKKPAIQGGYDYSHACGFYAGVWASSEQWVSDGGYGKNSLETDFYLGYKYSPVKDLTLDLGAIEYYYPGRYEADSTKPHTTEAYLGVSYKWASFKFSHSLTSDFFGSTDAKGVNYYDFTATPSLPYGLTLALHAGRQDFKKDYSSFASYNDYKVGISKEVVPSYTLALAYTYANTNGKSFYFYSAENKNIGGSQVALTFTKAF
ncbi:MAG: exported protein [Holophagaceae bacterium]|nr:exported protein [Holophagaceae bacterium]